ncbi:PH domain-containing protein [Aeromonas sp. Y311-2]|uniref:PH domain-containing protein n=1 Tax=Aeromonas sp. Y311-2 TaxID=2990507 RepID=UPI0022E52EBC|nr:PH domain-containing protein [Aeromonas sp. Y311-2]
MSYVDEVVTPGEEILVIGKTHWWIFMGPVMIVSLGVVLMLTKLPYYIGLIPLVWGGLSFFHAWIYSYSTELAVTNKRVIAKFGLISRHTIELKHERVESLQVKQSILGRCLNYGSISITGSGGTSAPIPFISAPLKFRSAALTGSRM